MLRLLLLLLKLLSLVWRLLSSELRLHGCHLWMVAGAILVPFRPPGMENPSFLIAAQLKPDPFWTAEPVPCWQWFRTQQFRRLLAKVSV